MSAQSDLALEHYLALGDLSLLMKQELRQVWAQIDGESTAAMLTALLIAVPGIAEIYGDMAAALAADFYESAREIADAPGRFVAIPAALPEASRFESLVRWGMEPIFGAEPRPAAALSQVEGGLQRIVANVARETVVDNSHRDAKAAGWQRITRGDGCLFCKMLAGKGAIYRSGSRFASHEDCKCVAAPAFDSGKHASPVQYEASKKRRSEADRDRLRQYMSNKRAQVSAEKAAAKNTSPTRPAP